MLVKCHLKGSLLKTSQYTNVHYFFPRSRVKKKVDDFKVRCYNLFFLRISFSIFSYIKQIVIKICL